MCFCSHKRARGSYPASNATRITFGLSAMNRPLSGSMRLRNWASVRVENTSIPGCDKEDISIMGIRLYSF